MAEPSTSFLSVIQRLTVAEWLSVLGLLVAIVGFAITIFNTIKSKNAAEMAASAANEARENIGKIDTVAELSAALKTMDEIKSLQREKVWSTLPYLYNALCEKLVSIRVAEIGLTEQHSSALNLALKTFRDLEFIIDEGLSDIESLSAPKYNKMLSKQMDSLREVLVDIKGQIGR